MANNNHFNFETELWQTAVSLRGTVAPAEYKNYVLPLLFMRYLSLRYRQRLSNWPEYDWSETG